MMNFDQLAMMTRGASCGLIILTIFLIWRDHRHTAAGKIAIIFLIGVMGHIIATIRTTDGFPNPAEWMLEIISNAVPGLFWLLSRAWFGDQKPGWKSWIIVSFSVLAMQGSNIMLYNGAENILFYTSPIARLCAIALVVAGLWIAWQGRDQDLIEERRHIRTYGIWAIGIYTVFVLLIETGMREPDHSLNALWRFGLISGIFLLVLCACASIISIRRNDLFGIPKMAPKTNDGEEAKAHEEIDDTLKHRLQEWMKQEMAWRDDTLSISDLAHSLNVKEYRLRKLINQQLGYRNFAAFLNKYRIAEVKQALADESQNEVPILTIALDAGYGSLGPFNRAFKDAEGITPTEYRAKHYSSNSAS